MPAIILSRKAAKEYSRTRIARITADHEPDDQAESRFLTMAARIGGGE